MVLAAGMGSRLGDVGKKIPKCLLEVGGKTMLEHVIDRLKAAGVHALCINTHHLASQVENFIKNKNNFGIEIRISYEPKLLGTGGGLKKVLDFFGGRDPFFMHNADVYCELDLTRLFQVHKESQALATLAVMQRESARALLFESEGTLAGWDNGAAGSRIIPGSTPKHRYGFSGIQIVSAEIFDFMSTQPEVFSIIETYMLAAQAKKRITSFSIDDSYWIDVGTTARLEELRARFYK